MNSSLPSECACVGACLCALVCATCVRALIDVCVHRCIGACSPVHVNQDGSRTRNQGQTWKEGSPSQINLQWTAH